jgi:TetR/AcrR family transcriptional regulator, mexJK operon transcriptional repressor
LFSATVDKLCVDILAPLATLNCAGAPLRQGLFEIAEILLMAIALKRAVALHRLAVAEAIAFPEIVQKWNSEGPERVYQILAHFIEWHQRAGNLTVEHPMLLASQLYGLLSGDLERRLLLGLARQPSKKKLIELITPAVDVFLCRYERNYNRVDA